MPEKELTTEEKEIEANFYKDLRNIQIDEGLRELTELKERFEFLSSVFNRHDHDGNESQQVRYINLSGNAPNAINVLSATIATTGNTDIYVIAPFDGVITEVDFSGVDALAASDSAYITFTITNLGQGGAGSTAILTGGNTNTTKVTGGSALSANTVRALSISITINATKVQKGDRLLIRAAATGTLANTITFPTYLLRFI